MKNRKSDHLHLLDNVANSYFGDCVANVASINATNTEVGGAGNSDRK